MPELPPPPSPDEGANSPSPTAAVTDALRQLRVAVADGGAGLAGTGRLLAGALALLVLGAIAWGAYVRGGSGTSPPPELTMPRAGSDAGRSSSTSTGATTRAGPSDPAAADAPTSASTSLVYVHVAGAVTRPGLYRLGGAPRVADAIDAAGGLAPTADQDAVNLAATVTDGERVYVPRVGEVPPAAAVVGSPTGGGTPTGPIDLNTATAEQLDSLPGVGPSTAQAIVSYRQEHGRFRSVDDLLEVRGIGPSKLEELRSKVKVR